MKGLLIKDILNMKNYMKQLVLVLIFFIAYGIFLKNGTFVGTMITLMLSMQVITTMSYDEYAKWDKYALTMNINRKDIIISKYIFFTISIIIGIVVGITTSIAINQIAKLDTGMNEIIVTSIVVPCVFAILFSIIIPVVFKTGVEKGRIVMMLILFIPAILVGAIVKISEKANITMPSPSNLEILMKFGVLGLVLLTIFGLIVISILLAKNVKGAFLIGMLIVSAVGMAIGLVEVPNAVVSSVPSMKPVFLQALSIPFDQIFSFDMFMVVLTFLFMDLFTTVGCLVGVASKGNMLDEDGKLPRVKQALLSDSIATTVGALLGTSTVTSYVESAAGIGEGGRTGLTAITTGFMFLLALFFAPIFTSIPTQATAPVLILVGVMMASSLTKIDFDDFTNAIPAFLTFAMMPLAYNIADGIIFGIISFTILKLVTKKKEEVNIYLIILSIIFVLKFIFLN